MDENQETKVTEQKKSNSTLIIFVVLAVLILGVGLWLGRVSFSSRNSNTSTTEITGVVNQADVVEKTTGSEENDVNVKTFEIEAGSYYFNPKEIRVNVGDRVKIVMTAVDMMHDFNIDELGVKVPITKAGNTSTVEFTANKSGEFEYYCSVGNHRAMGQIGTLIVEE